MRNNVLALRNNVTAMRNNVMAVLTYCRNARDGGMRNPHVQGNGRLRPFEGIIGQLAAALEELRPGRSFHDGDSRRLESGIWRCLLFIITNFL